MAKRKSNESTIGEVLQDFIASNRLQPGMDGISVATAWKNLMGNGVNAYTRSVTLRGHKLYVELTSSVLREELHYGKEKIIRMLNEELGRDVIEEVVLR